MKQQDRRIIEGTIWKEILRYFFPILLGSFFQQFYNTVDTIIVGQFAGKEALSAIGGSSAQIINFVVGFFSGLSLGVTVIISQYYGAKDEERMDRALHTSYVFAAAFGIAVGILCVIFCPQMLRMLNTPTEIMA
ncbi:MAG: MATE family efflux transporter, partial [Lachnospiraceae bacterium]|nr:MATE family efflux transporter [Lachnospiraceae bacterium]